MGRKRADVWNEYEEIEKEDSFKAKRVRCAHCGREFTAHANRMKDHLKECNSYKEALQRGTAHHIDLSSSKYETQRSSEYARLLNPNGSDISSKNMLRMGIVGGSIGSTMAPLHINAVMMSRRAKFVCGCFSSDPTKSKMTGVQYGIQRNRIYKTYEQMFQHEAELPESERMNFVVIATPTGTHFNIALLALENNFHVMCESPLCSTEEEAHKLYSVALERNLVVGVSYPICHFSMIHYARDLVLNNLIGEIVTIRVHYLQNKGTLEKDVGTWKLNSMQAGVSYCFSDLGIQAYQLVRFITHLNPCRISACLARSFGNRPLDDNATALLQMKEGGFCHLYVSKMSLLHQNDVSIEIDGSLGSIFWSMERPSELVYQRIHMSKQILTPESPPVIDHLRMRYSRLPFGHTENFLDAMTNMYDLFFNAVEANINKEFNSFSIDYSSIRNGMEGVVFLNRAFESTQRGSLWTDISFPSLMEGNTLPSLPTNGTSTVSGFSTGLTVNSFPNLNPIQPVSDIRNLNLPMQSIVQDDNPISDTTAV